MTTLRAELHRMELERKMRANLQAQAPVEYAEEERTFLECLDILKASVNTDDHYGAYARAKDAANWASEFAEIDRYKPDPKEIWKMMHDENEFLLRMSATLVESVSPPTNGAVVYSADFYDVPNEKYAFQDVIVIMTPNPNFDAATCPPNSGPTLVTAIFKGGRVDMATWYEPEIEHNDNGYELDLVLDELASEYLFHGGKTDDDV